jgi:hypothetical protein
MASQNEGFNLGLKGVTVNLKLKVCSISLRFLIEVHVAVDKAAVDEMTFHPLTL